MMLDFISIKTSIQTQRITDPYGYLLLGRHREISEAARPARRAVQSKNMWNESEINPKLQMTYKH